MSAAGHDQNDPDAADGASNREDMLAQVLSRALAARERGEPVDIAALCVAQPELASSVAAALDQVDDLPYMHRQATSIDAAIGGLLNERYRLQERIGAGAMGVVYRAEDLELGRSVAVKVLRPELVVGARMDVRLAREGEVLASIRHPDVVTVYDRGQAPDGRAFLVMELLRGCSAAQLLRSADEDAKGPLTARERVRCFQELLGPAAPLADNDVRQVVMWVAAAAAGLQAAHEAGVVHRDVKPSNLFVERDGRLVVVDFGIVSTGSHATLGSDGSPLGTPAYMAPEQLDVGGEPDARTDVYGLGATLYHLLTGQAPYQGSMQQVLTAISQKDPQRADLARPGLPVDLVATLEKAMARDPNDRYPTAAAFREDLIAWLEYRVVTARRASLLASGWRRARRSPYVRATAAVLLVFGVLAAWWNIADWRATQRIERAVESFAQVPPSLVDALPGHRATSNLRNNATIENLLDELVALADDPGVALALRVIHRSDSGDFRGAAEDAARIAAGGTAPFARLAAERYRQDKLPDDLAQGDTAPATGYAADRALAVVHAMRSRGPCPLWAATLLEQDDGLHQHLGFGELHLLLAWRRAYKLGPTDEGLAACEGLQQAVLQLETLRRRPSAIACYVQANALLQRAMFSEALSAATTGMALSPDDFTLAIAAGGAALNRNQFATAERMYRLALKLQPTSVHSHEQLCRTLLASGRLQDAEALLARIPFEESGLGEARHDILMGHLLYERAWLAARAEAAGAQPAAKPNDSDSLWRRALQSFTRARQIFGGDSSFEEVMCKGFLEDDAGCAELFQLLAQRPLDSHLIALVTEVLPATLNEQEVDALAQFLLRQIAQLGVRKR